MCAPISHNFCFVPLDFCLGCSPCSDVFPALSPTLLLLQASGICCFRTTPSILCIPGPNMLSLWAPIATVLLHTCSHVCLFQQLAGLVISTSFLTDWLAFSRQSINIYWINKFEWRFRDANKLKLILWNPSPGLMTSLLQASDFSIHCFWLCRYHCLRAGTRLGNY